MFKSPDVFLMEFTPFFGGFDFGPFPVGVGDAGFFWPRTSYFCHIVKIRSYSSQISPVRNATWNITSHLERVSQTIGLYLRWSSSQHLYFSSFDRSWLALMNKLWHARIRSI